MPLTYASSTFQEETVIARTRETAVGVDTHLGTVVQPQGAFVNI